MTTLYVVTGGTGFSLSTGGTGDQTLTAADDVILDGNSPNWTLTGDVGTVANTDGDYSASTAGLLSITATVAYIGTIDFDTYDSVIGSGGFDASAASGVTIQMGSGTIVSQGDFLVHASATLTDEASTLVMDGGTALSRLSMDWSTNPANSPLNLVIATGAFVGFSDLFINGTASVYGDVLLGNNAFFIGLNGTKTFHAGSVIAGSGNAYINANNFDLTIANGDNFGVIALCRSGCTLAITAGVLAGRLTAQNTNAGTFTLAAGSAVTDVLLDFTAANLLTVAFAGSNEVHGDVTESGATGTMAATGTFTLAGTTDQTWNAPQLDVSALTWGVNKAAGNVTVSNGDWTLGEDAGTVANTGGDYSASTQAADGIIVPVGNTGDVDFNDFDLVLGADGFDASAASGVTISMGSGTVVSQGDFIVHASATLTEETATLVMDGGTVGTPLELDVAGDLTALTVATGAYANTVKANTITTLKVYGDTTQDTTLTATTATYYDGSSTSGAESLNCDTLTIADADTFVRPVQISSGGTLTPTTGTLASAVTAINGAGGFPDPTTIASGSKITDLVFKFDAESAVFPIQMDAGLCDFGITNASNPFWIFPDGTTSTADRPAKTLASAGTVYLFCDDFTASTISVADNGTDSKYLGDLSDLPALTYWLNLGNCSLVTGDLSDLPSLTYYLTLYNCSNVTGSLADLPALTYWLNLGNCSLVTGALSDLPPLTNYLSLQNCASVTGDLSDLPSLTNLLNLTNCSSVTGALADLPPVTYYLSLSGCVNVTGALSDLPPVTNTLNLTNCSSVTGALADLPPVTYYLSLSGCVNVTGILPATVTATRIYLDSTGLSKTDLEQTIINVESNGSSNGIFDADTGMPTIDNVAAIAAVASLRGRDWTVTLAGGV